MRAIAFALVFAICLPAQESAGLAEARRHLDAREFEAAERVCRERLAELAAPARSEPAETISLLNVLARAVALSGRVPEALPIARQSVSIA